MKNYRGLAIEPKKDFGTVGFFLDGKYVKKGWLICKGMCNIVDGAGWFTTINKAKEYIDLNYEKLCKVAKQVEAM